MVSFAGTPLPVFPPSGMLDVSNHDMRGLLTRFIVASLPARLAATALTTRIAPLKPGTILFYRGVHVHQMLAVPHPPRG